MEHFEARKENYVQTITRDASGKGINTSRALTVNGVKNTAYVILGEENGAEFAAQLTRDGLTFVPLYAEGRIRENITLHPKEDRETRISLDTFSLAESTLDGMEAMLLSSVTAADLISFSGRLPRGITKEKAIAFLRRLIKTGARVIVDSNSFTPDDLGQIVPWFIKPNEQEIVSYIGRPIRDVHDAADVARKLVLRGIAEEVMISLGGDGAAWSNGEERLILGVPKLENPVSTIGAGDSTLAGLLAATAQGGDHAEALRTAVAYGTAACLTEGTLPPRPEDVRNIYEQVTVTELI
jgi:1-phosphofructokinase/6-phosphofructokinase 2